jgi:hypothetical protein
MEWRPLLFLVFVYGAGVEPNPLLLRPFIGLLSQPWMIDGDDCGEISGMDEWRGKPKYSEETCPSAAQLTIDPTSLDPGWNPGHRGGRAATNRLSYGTAVAPPNMARSLRTPAWRP